MPLSGTTKQSGSTKLGYGNYANAFAVWRSWRFAPFLRKLEGDFQTYSPLLMVRKSGGS